jgi:Ca2+-binding EF-hand superfamily protein
VSKGVSIEQVIDRDGKGFLTGEQIKKIMSATEDALSPEDIEDLMQAFSNEENKIFYDDYVATLSTLNE